ncbi:MAG TPA: hypothetical protein VGK19_13295 [Capsulimonadaceae bacterium]|jgi:hypothetical protein
MTTKLTYRITSLERWGMRVHADFQPAAVAAVRDAGFTGVLVNGGSGIGPDMLTPESLVESPVIPDLMPLTIKGNRREMARRCSLLHNAGLKPWLCFWGVPGPDESHDAISAESNRFFDRRSKLEMTAKLARTPELFGHRNPGALSWRGSRPLCVSHPLVRDYYRDLAARLVSDYTDLEGIFYFPGDSDPEICDDHCPRCRAEGGGPWGVMVRYVNELYEAFNAARPGFKFNFVVWNQDKPESVAVIESFLDNLSPGIGICMSLTDNDIQQRKSGPMTFNQPWVNHATPGKLFLDTAARAASQGRSVMALGEFSQAEVWDPACHNIPNPAKVIEFLRNSEKVPGIDSVCDFWGHRQPFVPHANHAAMHAYFADPSADTPALLHRAAVAHYGLHAAPQGLVDDALACWSAFDAAADDWALVIWAQRFSYAIGRDSARGPLYQALIPANMRSVQHSWGYKQLAWRGVAPIPFARWQDADREAFLAVAQQFDALAAELTDAGFAAGSESANREARNIELAGELIASVGRTFEAVEAFVRGDAGALRTIVEREIDARERQLEVSALAGWGAGVNPIFVDEDIQNMRLFLSHDLFPNPPDSIFHFTPTPYSA